MTRRIRFLAAAVLALAVLVAAALVIPRVITREEPQETDAPLVTNEYPLIDEELSALKGFTLTSRDNSITLLPAGDTWYIEGAEDVAISYYQADAASLYACHITAYEKIDATGLKPEEYGLAEPWLVLTSRFEGGERTVRFGDLSADGAYRYAMADGDDTLYMVFSNSLDYFDASADMYVVKPIQNPELVIGDVDYLRLERQGQPTVEFEIYDSSTVNEAEAYGTGHLLMKSPVKDRPVYMTNAQNFIIEPFTKLFMSKLAALAPESYAPYGLDEPRMKLAISTYDAVYTLVVGDETAEGDVYIMTEDEPCVFTIEAASLKPLFEADALLCVMRFVSILNLDDVLSIDVRLDDMMYRCEINAYIVPGGLEFGGDAEEIAPTVNGQPVADTAFKGFYSGLIGMQYEAILERAMERPEASADIEVVFNLTNGKAVTDSLYKYDANYYSIWSDYYGADSNVEYLISRVYMEETFKLLDNAIGR